MTEEEIDVKAVQDAITQVEAYRKTLEASRLQREANLNPDRPKEDALKQLDSSVKRNTALIKKLRAVSEDSVKGVLEDISKVNQLKYVSEAVAAVAEAPLKVSDVPAALSVCCLLHQRYADFGNQIAPALAKSFSGKATSPDEERVLMRRRRSCLKLLADLMLAGVWTGLQPLQGMVQELATTCIKKDRETAQNSLSLLSTFAKGAREQILSLPPVVPLLPVPKELLEGQHYSLCQLSTFAEGAREQILSLPPLVPLLPVPKELLEGQHISGQLMSYQHISCQRMSVPTHIGKRNVRTTHIVPADVVTAHIVPAAGLPAHSCQLCRTSTYRGQPAVGQHILVPADVVASKYVQANVVPAHIDCSGLSEELGTGYPKCP
eukprot:gene14701-20741_t